jgi:hypothetical protein
MARRLIAQCARAFTECRERPRKSADGAFQQHDFEIQGQISPKASAAGNGTRSARGGASHSSRTLSGQMSTELAESDLDLVTRNVAGDRTRRRFRMVREASRTQ